VNSAQRQRLLAKESVVTYGAELSGSAAAVVKRVQRSRLESLLALGPRQEE